MTAGWREFGRAAEIAPGGMLAREVGGVPVVVCRTADGLHALYDVCTHAEARMSEGRLRGHRLTCPLHGAAFDCRSGAVLARPATVPLRRYAVRVTDDGRVEVDIDG